MSESDGVRTGDRGLWIGMLIGGPVVLYGLWGAVAMGDRTKPLELAAWIIGLALVHDLVLVPLVLMTGWAMTRWVPASARPFVRWALVTSAVLVLVAWPSVRRYGVSPDVPSLLPRNYAVGLMTYIAGVWLVAAGVWAIGWWWRRRRALPPALGHDG